jgi:hypothetical protein
MNECRFPVMIASMGISNLVDLSVKLVETNMHNVYNLVYLLLKLVLILPVAMSSVERAFSLMNFIDHVNLLIT